MSAQHPITPSPELAQWWWAEETYDPFGVAISRLATKAARWGADQQLAEDAKWLDQHALDTQHLKITPVGGSLIKAMRPELPSLAEQATAELDDAVMRGDCITTTDAMPLLRAAIKRLAELDTNAHYSP